MDAQRYIKIKQILWAQRNGTALVGSKGERGEKAYVQSLDKNFCIPLSEMPEVKEEFKRGDGKELDTGTGSAKIQAVHSSAALTCNIFCYWRKNKNYARITEALRIPSKEIESINFEEKLQIGKDVNRKKFPRDPNMDVFIKYEGGKQKAVGIECKFSEAYSTQGHDGLRKAYLEEESLWTGIPNIRKLAGKICPHDKENKYLHAAQLIKHILGLKHFSDGIEKFRLVYLWYDVPFDVGYLHRREIEKFTEVAAADGIKFQAITYQEVIINLSQAEKDNHPDYIRYITSRYL